MPQKKITTFQQTYKYEEIVVLLLCIGYDQTNSNNNTIKKLNSLKLFFANRKNELHLHITLFIFFTHVHTHALAHDFVEYCFHSPKIPSVKTIEFDFVFAAN